MPLTSAVDRSRAKRLAERRQEKLFHETRFLSDDGSRGRLPTRGNFETITHMKTFGAHRCLFKATISLLAALLPLPGVAQEPAPTNQPSNVQAASPQIGEQRFVSDKLVLNVYSEPDSSSSRVATIQTGDAVEELERSGNMVRVRLEDGREGWVGANYLTRDAPAIVRLRELQREQTTGVSAPVPDKKSIDEIARLKKENSALQAQTSELQSRLAAAVAPPEPVDDESASPLDTPEPEVASEQEAFAGAVSPVNSAWWAWLIAVVLAGGLGFASGYQMLARRIRRKFGGLRIY
jgi:hypothetical protein